MKWYFTLYVAICLSGQVLVAQPLVEFTPVTLSGPSLNQPVDIANAGDGSNRLFVVEKRGTVRIIENGVVQSGYFLDIQNQVMNSGERGLLGLAFHPQYPDSPYIYVDYVLINTITSRIARFTLNPNDPDDILENSQVVLLSQTGVQSNHKAGDLAFGPDGYLYLTFGDGGGANDPTQAAQNLNTFLGKILRINVDATSPPLNYSIPPDNPFVGIDGLDEIWFYGMRNPWRISFDRGSGDLWIADVGQNQWEEVDYIPAGTPGGLNFGWDCQEGNHPLEPNNCDGSAVLTWPIFEYPHNCNPCPDGQGASITGGYVYRGNTFPGLVGYYICVDYISDNFWLITPDGSVIVDNASGTINDIVTFGEDEAGELYAAGLDGVIYQIVDNSSLPVMWENLDVVEIVNGNKVLWTIQHTNGIDHFEVERALEPGFGQFQHAGNVSVVQDQIHYSFTDRYYSYEGLYYRVVAVMTDGGRENSPILRLLPDPVSKPSLVYDAGHGMWRLHLPDYWQTGEILLYDLNGKEVLSRKLNREKMVELGPPIIPGCYFIQVITETGTWSDRIVL